MRSAQGFDRGKHFDGAGCTHQVAVQRLGGANGNPSGLCAEHLLDRIGFAQVADLGAGAVGVDVIDLFGRQSGFSQCQAHRPCLPRRFRLRDVSRVGGVAVTHDFSQYRCAARLCRLFFFQNQCGRAFAEYKAGAIGGKWPARCFGAFCIHPGQGFAAIPRP